MKAAGIDIGSNTSLLLIAEKTDEGFEVLLEKIYFTRLAENLEQTGQISESALSRLEQAFASMSAQLQEKQIHHTAVAATSAARLAKNKSRILELGQKYGIAPVEIVSPQREAELTFIGALFGLGREFSRPIVVDIGGGSTELVSAKKSFSLNIGSVSLTERFLTAGPLSDMELRPLAQYIRSRLQPVSAFLEKGDYDGLIFTAGVPTTLAFMEKQSASSNDIHGLSLKKSHIQLWLKKLAPLSLEERKKIPGLPEWRSDVIPAGLSLLLEILQMTKREEFIVSATGLRYGLILERFQKL